MLTTSKITFDEIVEKTKRMLGENYRGDTELTPVYSELSSIEGHTDASLIISNGGFTNDEITLIQEKTKNYAWWVANHGYLVDSSNKEISALFIYGSEMGSVTPDVLNFTGAVTNNFYNQINRTDLEGNINNSANHIYVQYELDGEIQEYETDRNGNSDIEINNIAYTIYAGRLYPEDKKIIDNTVTYPIYLISNLDYYSITDLGATALNGSHDTEQVEQSNLEILEDTCDMVINEAAQWTNRLINDLFLYDCWPVIVKCSCMAYLNRGAEGLKSQTELGQQNTYNDWVSIMHQQLTNRRYVL